MLRPDNDRGRPLTTDGPTTSITTDESSLGLDTDKRPRCRVCRHVIWSDVAVATGMGRRCREAAAVGVRAVA